MPLSPPVGDSICIRAASPARLLREDGLWDIEAITDEKPHAHSSEWRSRMKPGDLIHDMSIRCPDHRPSSPSSTSRRCDRQSPLPICGNVTPDFKKLIGLRIGAASIAVRAALGVHGCTPHRRAVKVRWRPRPIRPCRRAGASRLNRAIANAGEGATTNHPTEPSASPICHRHLPRLGGRRSGGQRWAPDFYTGPDAEAAARRRPGDRDGRVIFSSPATRAFAPSKTGGDPEAAVRCFARRLGIGRRLPTPSRRRRPRPRGFRQIRGFAGERRRQRRERPARAGRRRIWLSGWHGARR